MSFPVIVGVVPLFAVTSFAITEGYKAVQIAGSSLVQMVTPTTKTIQIEALLVEGWRALRPALEAMALTSRALAAVTGPLMKFTGIPIVAKSGVHVDMQITNLVFTQDNQMRDTLRVSMTLAHVPRARITELIGAAADVGLAAGSALI